MKNGKHILIGDNSYDFGRILSNFLSDNGFEIMCRRNDASLLKNEILSSSPDAAVICVSDEDDPVCTLISDIASSDCPTKILAAVFSASKELCRRLIEIGADKCILMPASMVQILNILNELSCAHRHIPFEPEIISFLTDIGIPAHLKGFSYLSTGTGLCIVHPEYISDITNKLYTELAEIYSTAPLTIERAVRHVAQLAHENGSDIRLAGMSRNFTVTDSPLTNYELFCAAADAFAEKYSLYR